VVIKGETVRVKSRSRHALVATVLALAVGAAACSSSTATNGNGGSGGSSTTSAGAGAGPRVTPSMSATKTSCASSSSCFTSGNIATIGGVVPGLFKGALVGADAYLAWQNSLGGLDGKKFKLISEDDQFNCNNNKAQTQQLIQQGAIAITGSFSLEDNCGGQVLAQNPTFPDVSVTLDPTTAGLPNVFSPQPLAQGMATGPLMYFKQKFPDAYKKVGTLVANAGSAPAQWVGEEAAFKHEGYKILYQRMYGPFETDFTSDILKMQQAGVQMLVLISVDQNITSRILSEAHQQGWHPQVIWGGASTYTDTLVQQAGGPSVADGFYLEQANALYLGQDAKSVPQVNDFLHWVHGLYPGFVPDLFTLYGWTSAELYVDALKKAGSDPTQASLMTALKGTTNFNADGMVAPANPAAHEPPSCWLLAKITNGQFQRFDMPKTGFRCDGTYYHAPKK
jgi:ABC-type branched-subunit amino acid transport system substrate-binding protein